DTERHQADDSSCMEEGVQLREFAQNGQRLFESASRAKNGRLLNFVVRTAPGRAANWPSPFASPSIFWQQPLLPMRREKPLAMSPAAFLEFGSPGRTRTSDQAVNSRSLYQLSYRGSEPRWRAPPLEAGSGIEPLYEDLQSSA